MEEILQEQKNHPKKVKLFKKWPLYLMVIPALVSLLIWFYYPVLESVKNSLYDWDGMLAPTHYIGLNNYITIFQDTEFWMSMKNMGLILIFMFTIPFFMPFIAAELITGLKSKRAREFYRTLLMLPAVVPMVVTILLWRYIYDYDGLLNMLLKVLGLPLHDWLNEPSLALLAVLFVSFPFIGTTALLIYTAGLEDIPQEVHESAKMDGISVWKRIIHIDIPFCIPQFRFQVVTTLGGIIANYVVVYMLTRGGPLFRTTVPGFYMFDKAFNFQRFGYACAVGVILILIIMALTIFTQHHLRSDTEYYVD